MLVNNAINPMRRNQSLCASMIYHFSFSLLKGALLIALFPKPKCTQAKLDFSAFERRFFFWLEKISVQQRKTHKKVSFKIRRPFWKDGIFCLLLFVSSSRAGEEK